MFFSDSIVPENYNHFSRLIVPVKRYYYPLVTSAVSDHILVPRCIEEPSRHLALPALLPPEDLVLAPHRRFVVAKNKKVNEESLPFSAKESGVDSKNERRHRQFPSRGQHDHLTGAHISSLSSPRDTRLGQFKGLSSNVPSKMRGDTWEVQSPPLGPLSLQRSTLTEGTTTAMSLSTTNSSEASTRFRPYQSENWMERYTELVEFHRQHGHCLVPNNYKESPSLAEWVKRQRHQNKLKALGVRNTMTPERMKKLEKLGFVWNSHDQMWEEHINNLKIYKEINGDCNVPNKYPPDPALATWVKRQRWQYKLMVEGKDSFLTPYRVKSLTEIGFFGKDDAPPRFRARRS